MPAVGTRDDRRPVPAVLLASLLLLPLLPGPAAGQGSDDRVEIYLGGSGGRFWTGQERLYTWSRASQDGTFLDVARATLDPGFAAGVDLKARVPALHLDFGLAVERTLGTGGVLSTTRICRVGCLALLGPARPGGPHAFDADFTLVSAHLDFRNLPSVWRVQPFLTAGYGVEVYEFGTEAVPDTVTAALPRDTHTPTFRLGAGMSVPVRNLEIVARVTDYLSGYEIPAEGNTVWQQHLTATLGLVRRIR